MGVEVIRELQNQPTDAEAQIEAYLEGDVQAGELLAAQVRNILSRRFRRLSAAAPVVDELVQDCMLQVFARLPEYNVDKGLFESWVGGFAINSLRAYRRREARARTSALPVEEMQSLSYNINHLEDDRELLTAALDSLDLLDRELLHMRYSLGMSSEEIAASSDLNAPQVRKRISRAVERLRRHPAMGHILQ